MFDLFPSDGSDRLYVFNFGSYLFYVDYDFVENAFYFYTGKSCIKYYAAFFRFESYMINFNLSLLIIIKSFNHECFSRSILCGKAV